MREAFAIAALCAVCATPASAGSGPPERLSSQPSPRIILSDFDLTNVGGRRLPREKAAPGNLQAPRGMDLHTSDWVPPAIEFTLAENGPVFAAGAMGSRRKGVPKLAHVAIDWNF